MKEIYRLSWFLEDDNHRPLITDPHAMPLFPEDAPGDDRIIYQLMYTLPKDGEEVPIKRILLSNGLKTWGIQRGFYEFFRSHCPVNWCYLTGDSKDAATADAILFKDRFIPFNVRRPPNQIWIFYYLKTPGHAFFLNSSLLNVGFNWTATYRRDSEIVVPYQRWVYYDPLSTEKKLKRNFTGNKTKKVFWFVSNEQVYKRRVQYVRQLSKLIPVDIYGAYGSLHCPKKDPKCFKILRKEYKFYLAFENVNCRDYITNVFFNALKHRVIPIAMGARLSDYEAVAPRNSYIHVEEFNGAEEIAAYLRRLDEDDELYNSYFNWKGKGEFIETHFFCRICAMLHANERRHRVAHYNDVQAWWRDGACTKSDWWNIRDFEYVKYNNNNVTQACKISLTLFFLILYWYLVLNDLIL